MDTTQTNLLRAVVDAQDTRAWGDFYTLYAGMIGGFARRMGLPDADADDVTQEVLVAAHRALREGLYDPAKGGFRAWLHGVARRQSLARLRERRRRTRAQWAGQTDSPDLLDQLEGRPSESATLAVWREEWRYAVLNRALSHAENCMPVKEYQAFVMYAIERKGVDDVARQLGITPASVYVYKHRVLSGIREWIARFEPQE